MTNPVVKLTEKEADKRSISECKECPLLRIEDGSPTCMFTNENLPEDCQILEIR